MISRKENLNPQGNVILLNEAIERVTKLFFLVVIVGKNLNWKDHISMVSPIFFKIMRHHITYSEYFLY